FASGQLPDATHSTQTGSWSLQKPPAWQATPTRSSWLHTSLSQSSSVHSLSSSQWSSSRHSTHSLLTVLHHGSTFRQCSFSKHCRHTGTWSSEQKPAAQVSPA